MEVSEEELTKRKEAWVQPESKFTRGYGKLYFDETTQANHGCDFRFLHADGSRDKAPDIY